MRLIVISGRSGSGKSTALNELADQGFYCIDNLPAALLPALVEQAIASDSPEYNNIAVCIDARNAWKDLDGLPELLDLLPDQLWAQILFLDADDSSLLKRFSETRRRHPLTTRDVPLAEALRRESGLLEPIATAASLTVDSSDMSIYELRNLVRQRLIARPEHGISIQFQSFGFKRGIPGDSDLVFDVRVLPNPHWIPTLREKSGKDEAVIEFLCQEPLVIEMLSDIGTYLETWLPHYAENNRSYITISIGCTGGQHRSVYIAERLHDRFTRTHDHVLVRHRELSQIKPV